MSFRIDTVAAPFSATLRRKAKSSPTKVFALRTSPHSIIAFFACKLLKREQSLDSGEVLSIRLPVRVNPNGVRCSAGCCCCNFLCCIARARWVAPAGRKESPSLHRRVERGFPWKLSGTNSPSTSTPVALSGQPSCAGEIGRFHRGDRRSSSTAVKRETDTAERSRSPWCSRNASDAACGLQC